MHSTEGTFWKLILIGAVIGLGKLLEGGEVITMRLVIGRLIIGSAVSCVAGVALIQFKGLPELALLGIASGLGILGHSAIEALFNRWMKTSKKETRK